MNENKLLAIGLACLLISTAAAQPPKTKAQLQREKQQNLERIKQTERILGETAQKKKNTLGELNALNQRIQQQETLLVSIRTEIELLDDILQEDQTIIEALERDLAQLKAEYARMAYAAQKASGKADRLMLLFASRSFDQLLMRLKYMEQYGQARQSQAEAIVQVQEILSEQVRITEAKKDDKQDLLREVERENGQLTRLKNQQRELVRNLEKEEKKLRQDVDETKKAVAKLDQLINAIIREEMARAEREAREREARNRSLPAAPSPLSAVFEGNKNQFGWPAPGFVTQRFGRQQHPVLKKVEINSDGVIIQTKQGERVRAIFEGEVRRVALLPVVGGTVIIKHGEYFTVYSGLKDIFVKSGDRVTTQQQIGVVLVNSDGISELRFQIYKNTQALDPQTWLRP